MKKFTKILPASYLLVVAAVLVMAVLRFSQLIAWSWPWILAPLWIFPMLFFLALGIMLFAAVLIARTGSKK